MVDSSDIMAPPLRRIDGPHQEILLDGTEVSSFSQRELTLYTANRAIQAVQEAHAASEGVKVLDARTLLLQEDVGRLARELSGAQGSISDFKSDLDMAITRGMNTRELRAYRAKEKRTKAIMLVLYGAIFSGAVGSLILFLTHHIHLS
jgi:hypothetical protein